MRHKAIILRVNRNAAGAHFPFDKMYFFKKGAQEHFSRIFRCAMVVVPTKPFIQMVVSAVEAHACSVGKVYPLKRCDEEKMAKAMRDELPINDVIANYKNYVGLVPILYLQRRETKEEIVPQYLHASQKVRPGRALRPIWRKTKTSAAERAHDNIRRMFSDTFTSRSYFLMDNEKYSPICTVCENSLLMVTGKCRLGDRVCFEKLAQVKPSNFRKNMNRYLDWVKQVGEPELKLEAENE